jgi:hypothetical protein
MKNVLKIEYFSFFEYNSKTHTMGQYLENFVIIKNFFLLFSVNFYKDF